MLNGNLFCRTYLEISRAGRCLSARHNLFLFYLFIIFHSLFHCSITNFYDTLSKTIYSDLFLFYFRTHVKVTDSCLVSTVIEHANFN